MKVLVEIHFESLGLGAERKKLGAMYQLRKSARVILRNDENKIAVQYLHNRMYHKLPGGGMEKGESVEDALRREVREEVGCECEVLAPVGMVIEYHDTLLHISYCYSAQVLGELGSPILEPNEVAEGQETLWLEPKETLAQMKQDTPNEVRGHFILKRESSFLEEYLTM